MNINNNNAAATDGDVATSTPLADAPTASGAPEEIAPMSYMDRIRGRFGDSLDESLDEEALRERYVNEVEEELGGFRESTKSIQDVIDVNPELGQLLYDIVVNKLPVRVAIVKNFDPVDLVPIEGDIDFDAYQSAFTERSGRVQAFKDLRSEIERNQEASIALLDSFAEDKGLTEEQKEKLYDSIDEALQKVLRKEISIDLLEAFYNNMMRDEDLAAAKEAGEIDGRNTAIEATIIKEASNTSGDGLPTPPKGSDVAPVEKSINPMFEGIGERPDWTKTKKVISKK